MENPPAWRSLAANSVVWHKSPVLTAFIWYQFIIDGVFFCLAQSSLLERRMRPPHPFALGERSLSSSLVLAAGDAQLGLQNRLVAQSLKPVNSVLSSMQPVCFANPVEQLFTFQAINIITIMLRSNFGEFCSEPSRLRRDSFSRDLSFWWKPNCSFGFV